MLHISRLRRQGIIILEAAVALRRALGAAGGPAGGAARDGLGTVAMGAAFAPIMWRGVDYLVKMLHDTDFITELPGAVRLPCTPRGAIFFRR